MLYIGVDLGTSAVKLLLMDENGNIHKIVSREYPLYFPHPGWSEQKPEDWFAQSMEGIREQQRVTKVRSEESVLAVRCMVWWYSMRRTMCFVRQSSGMTDEQRKRRII